VTASAWHESASPRVAAVKGGERAASDAARALAAAILPAGRRLPAAGERALVAARALLGGADEATGPSLLLSGLVESLDWAAVLRTGSRFSRLAPGRREELLRTWEHDPVARWPLFVLSSVLKLAHYDDPDVYAALGCTYHRGGPAEAARWLQQVHPAASLGRDTHVECDVVVVGTGAGGAVVGKELAERGLAVVFVEEGDLHRRDAFNGRAADAHRRFYRGKGAIAALGNNVIPVFMGRMVGGSTAVNTGTCFRTPEWILTRWCETLGTDALAPERMAPHFARVEEALGVQPARAPFLGGVARVVARGCDRLGWHHFALRRNAPDCDGQGICDLGCPTDARRSTNLSYMPPALSRGAVLYTGMRAHRVLTDGGRAVGIDAVPARGGAAAGRLRVRARAVVLAGGAIPTPLFLMGQGLCNASGQVGRNLSLHPATVLSALFDEPIKGYDAIPQGYGVDEFHREGILLLGAAAPPSLGAMLLPFAGKRFTETMEAYDRVASFGIMVEDEARGRVRIGRGGRPLITYFLGSTEVERLHRGMVRVAEIFRAAGARRLLPLLPRLPILDGDAGLEKLRAARLRPWDFVLSSFHPIGTCRMGKDPRTSVVGLDHQAHDMPGLYVVDGSTVPGPPAVNPQITIMAMADRAAGLLAERLA